MSSKCFWAFLGMVMSMLAAHAALSGDVANTVFTCFAAYICYDSMKDVAKIKHAKWKLADDGDGVVCSNCREDFCNIYLEVDRFKYCPNCGAKMDLED